MALKFAEPKAQYSKSADLKEEDVKAFLEWAHKQPHLPEINELEAILFVHSCYNRNEAAKTAIDNYFTIRTVCPELFKKKNPGLSVALFTVLPKETPEGYRIVFAKLMDFRAELFSVIKLISYYDMVSLLNMYQEGIAEGYVLVLDFKGFTIGHFFKLNPLVLQKFFYYFQEALPVRIKGIHAINCVSFMDKIFALVKPFLKKELIEIIYFHQELDGLDKFVPLDCMPENYGGSVESITVLHEKICKKIDENAAFFEWEDSLSVDKSKMEDKVLCFGDDFGVEGTFKKLQLD